MNEFDPSSWGRERVVAEAHFDAVGVLNDIRTRIGPTVPRARRTASGAIQWEWLPGVSADTVGGLSAVALQELGSLLSSLHNQCRDLRPHKFFTHLGELPTTVVGLRNVALDLGLDLPPGWPEASSPALTWTHGDVSNGNVLVNESGILVGIIDWEFLAWDVPTFDVAHALWKTAPLLRGREEHEVVLERSNRLLAGYGWTSDCAEIVVFLSFLFDRRLENIPRLVQEEQLSRRTGVAEEAEIRAAQSYLKDNARYLVSLLNVATGQ